VGLHSLAEDVDSFNNPQPTTNNQPLTMQLNYLKILPLNCGSERFKYMHAIFINTLTHAGKYYKRFLFATCPLVFFISFVTIPCISAQTHVETVVIDGQSQGRQFDGVGAISAGASSRLLYDYPEPERSQILDYLFKPNYGASLQILKVEIGGDMNSTDGSEASHMRTRGHCNCNLGYEWWLMKEAKKRNPDIKLAGLEWGAPGWLKGGFWSQDNIKYLMQWLKCAKKHGLKIDYMGGWNESGYNAKWYIKFGKKLHKAYPHIKLIGADQAGGRWKFASVVRHNPTLDSIIDIIGVHNPCGGRLHPRYEHCRTTKDALSLEKPLWSSEFSSLSHNTGAIPIARALNRSYIDASVTGQMIWSAISAWYADFPIADTGPILAEWPWSGYYEVGKSVWALAQTTQFTKPGWYYLNTGSKRLKSGATIVSLISPSGKNYSMIIETTDMKHQTTLHFRLKNLPQKKLQIWATNLHSNNSSSYFRHIKTITPQSAQFQLTLKPGSIYSISTLTSAGRGHAQPKVGPAKQLPIPFDEHFDEYKKEHLARYFSDVNGGFQTEPCRDGRSGMCYEQMITMKPITWHGKDMAPTTIVGDPRWWGDYRAGVDALIKNKGFVELMGRVDGVGGSKFVSGYHLRVSGKSWRLYSENVAGSDTTLVQGKVSFHAPSWHNLALKFKGDTIQVFIDSSKVGEVRDNRHHTGQVGLRTSKWLKTQFDNVKVVPTAHWPHFIPHIQMKTKATSVDSGNVFGYSHPASAAVDDRPESFWRSSPKARGPQAITIDLGKIYRVQGLTYQPQISGNWAARKPGNPITNYIIYLSKDGKNFKKVASGIWRNSMAATKVVRWKKSLKARYIWLKAVGKHKNGVTVGTINVIGRRAVQ
jgi:O-glycosyl hydrolase